MPWVHEIIAAAWSRCGLLVGIILCQGSVSAIVAAQCQIKVGIHLQ